MRRVGSPVVVLAALLAACGDGSGGDEGGADRASGGSPVPKIVVTRDDRSLPAGCRPRRVAILVSRFFEAFNRGDVAAARAFAPELVASRGWYSVTEGTGKRRRHFVARDRGELRRYVTARHRQGERLRLIELRVNASRGDFELLFERRARDLAPLGIRGPRAGGKGAIDCERGKIVVWSVGMPHGGSRVCPAPVPARRGVVACVRRSGG